MNQSGERDQNHAGNDHDKHRSQMMKETLLAETDGFEPSMHVFARMLP